MPLKRPAPESMLIRLAWRLLALLFVALGMIGAVLPGMPTTVFLLLALWAAARGWPQLHDWLLNHPVYGEHLRNWQEQRAVPRRAKWLASLSMALSGLILALTLGFGLWVCLAMSSMILVASWLWSRPEPKFTTLTPE
ncbi:YbaN family protein [Marinobacterium lutimaris]|uniref:Inner membrane protein n=1 Tax=Marinobacterium lutimaris TaxID=568106 RepID=A0A1H6DIQ9_9GAMM|nr:YbaN family protein [Marinobacterium lutimaris]SEG84733.1 hypothetical protein SAMN05444390_106177 [Marinobacterium lutimaris]